MLLRSGARSMVGKNYMMRDDAYKHPDPPPAPILRAPTLRAPICDEQATTIVMSLRNSRQGDKTPPGPDLQASRPAERGSRNAGGASGVMVFSQVFVMAPIRSQDVELIFDVTQAKHRASPPRIRDGKGAGGGGSSRAAAPRRAGTCRVSLRELADQREHDLPLTVLTKASSSWVGKLAILYGTEQ